MHMFGPLVFVVFFLGGCAAVAVVFLVGPLAGLVALIRALDRARRYSAERETAAQQLDEWLGTWAKDGLHAPSGTEANDSGADAGRIDPVAADALAAHAAGLRARA